MAQDLFGSSPDLDLRKRWALMQLQSAGDASPVRHPLQAVARAIQGGFGGYMAGQAEQADRAAGEAMFSNLPGLNGNVAPPQASPAPVSQPMGNTSVSGGDTSLPRGLRNNNPGNIEDGPFAQRQPGYLGSDGRFAKFASTDHGITAASNLLAGYGDKGINTINGIVSRWAPPSDGNNTSAYAATVAKKLGISPDAPLDMKNPVMRGAIAQYMFEVENGRPVPTGGQPAGGEAIPPQAQAAQFNGQPQTPQANTPSRTQLNIPPEVAATIQRLGADPRTRGQAWQMYLQYAKPVESVTPMSGDERKQWNVPEGVSAGIDRTTGKPVFSQPANNVSVNTAANPIYEGVAKQLVEQRKGATTAATEIIPSIHEARKALDAGATTGAFADAKVSLQKFGAMFGFDASQAQNTEVLRASIGNQVLGSIKALGANPSNADRDYIEKVQGGQIALEEKSIRRILDIQEKYARQSIKNFNRDAGKLMSVQGGNEAYKGISPLMSIEEPGQYEAPKANAAPNVSPDRAAIEQEMKRRGLLK